MSNKKPTLSSTRQAFGDTLNLMASKNKNIFVVSVDLKSSLKLSKFAKKYPNRFIECGVAEQNATAIAAGLAKSGKTVFFVFLFFLLSGHKLGRYQAINLLQQLQCKNN